jgi:NAD(P)-dependent dehydrogenase (short-subunit alcohol dehydrogenase family)
MNIFSDTCLAGKTYLITGASSGIGLSAAQLMSFCGARLIVSGRDTSRLTLALTALDKRATHVIEEKSLSDADDTADWVKALSQQHGALDGIFHCAGTELIRPARLTKQEHLNEVFGSSVFASFGIARASGQKGVLTDGASVVFMSSVAGSTGQGGMTAYSAAKASIDGLVRSLACELAPRKIRANTIAAGAVHTAMHERLIKNNGEAATQHYEAAHLLGFGNPYDIANAVVFLLSDAARWITGTTMFVDGGYVVR